MRIAALIVASLVLAACSKRSEPTAEPAAPAPETAQSAVSTADGSGSEQEATTQPTSRPASGSVTQGAPPPTSHDELMQELVLVDPLEIARRTYAAYERLQASEAGRLIWSSMEAHGGLSIWYSNGPLAFRFTYTPTTRPATDTRQLVDTWSARAVHQLADDPDTRFGWDGERAWVSDPEAELPTNPRFWALTPYYFVGLPFVLSDEGINLTLDGEMDFEGSTCDLVRATFDDEVGDAPGDYYVVLIDRETRLLRGVRYVVSYPGFHPDGGHGPEKLLAFDGLQRVDDILLPESYRTFTWSDDGSLGDVVTNTTLTEVSFRPSLKHIAFNVPESATVLEGY